MKRDEVILKHQSIKIFFNDGDTDFFFYWLLGIGEVFGLSHGELYYLVRCLGKLPKSELWRKEILSHVKFIEKKLSPQSKEQYQRTIIFGRELCITLGDSIHGSIPG